MNIPRWHRLNQNVNPRCGVEEEGGLIGGGGKERERERERETK